MYDNNLKLDPHSISKILFKIGCMYLNSLRRFIICDQVFTPLCYITNIYLKSYVGLFGRHRDRVCALLQWH